MTPARIFALTAYICMVGAGINIGQLWFIGAHPATVVCLALNAAYIAVWMMVQARASAPRKASWLFRLVMLILVGVNVRYIVIGDVHLLNWTGAIGCGVVLIGSLCGRSHPDA